MAMQVGKLIVGADVAKAELVIHHDDRDEIIKVKNTKPEIKKWLKQQPLNTAMAVEATNVYHLDLVELAHSLGLKIVAEGVETEGQESFLIEHRCDLLQGYRYGRPLPAAQVAALLPRA